MTGGRRAAPDPGAGNDAPEPGADAGERRPDAPRRILYNELNEDGTVGGSHQCLVDLVRHLDRRRFEPVAVFYQDNSWVPKLREAGVEVHVWEAQRRRERAAEGPVLRPARAASLLAAIARRAAFIRERRIDLVHLNNTPVLTCADWLPAARITRRPVLSHCRAEFVPPAGRARRWLSSRFDRIVAISRTVEGSLRRAGIPETRIVRVYDGIDAEALRARVRSDPGEVRRRLGVDPGALLVVMVGHLRAWKGQDVLLAALERLGAGERSRQRTLFVGGVDVYDPAYAASLREIAAARGLDGCVAFLGEREDAPDLMHAADVVVHASKIPEPFGLVVLEGMALGKPVVASALGGPGEIVTPGTGLLFDPSRPEELAAHLARLAADPSERRALGEAGRERVRAFGIAANVEAIQAIYADLLEGSRSA